MADTSTPIGTINLWNRSTDLTTLMECQGKYFLGRLYEPDAGASYFHFGTSVHLYVAERHQGASPDEARATATRTLHELLIADEGRYGEVRWTKKRPEEDVWDNLAELIERAEVAMVELRDAGWQPIAIESRMKGEGGGFRFATDVDAIYETDEGFVILDWKSGSTAKANPVQLHFYMYAARHDPNSPIYGASVDKVRLAFYHLAFNKIQWVDDYPGDPYTEGLLRWATDQKDRAVDEGFAPFRPDWYCNYCLYQSKCPLYGGSLDTFYGDLTEAGVETIEATEEGADG